MTGLSRDTWTATTHRWLTDVDRDHLERARRLVGPVGPVQLAHLVLEVLAYADDEAAAQGVAGSAVVEIAANEISVADDGRGTDTRLDENGVVVRKPVMATRDIRFFDETDAPALPDGLARRGMSSVAAVCGELIHENHRADGSWSQTYRFGIPSSHLTEIPAAQHSGTTVRLRQLDQNSIAGVDMTALATFARQYKHLTVAFSTE